MIEDAGALEDVEAILALDTVDGVFVGPSDLSMRRNRGAYSRDEGDFADLQRVAKAAAAAGKAWVLPAWSPEEKEFALRNGADQLALTMQHGALAAGLSAPYEQARALVGSLLSRATV